MEWQERILSIADGQLAYYEAGEGPAVLFLSGGPGDDHQYLRPLAAPLTDRWRCVLLDQRGVGKSALHRRDAETISLPRFLDDLEQMRVALGQERLTLVGHSWGATYALLYAAACPDRVEGLALVGLGPINDEMAAVAHANVLRPFSAEELERRRVLRQKRDEAVDRGDQAACLAIDLEWLEMNTRSSFYSRAAATAYMADLRAGGGGPDRMIGRLLWPRVLEAQAQFPGLLPKVTARVLALYGFQDFEPITQAYILREWMPQTEICLINECGHLPWREQPDRFYAALRAFLPHA